MHQQVDMTTRGDGGAGLFTAPDILVARKSVEEHRHTHMPRRGYAWVTGRMRTDDGSTAVAISSTQFSHNCACGLLVSVVGLLLHGVVQWVLVQWIQGIWIQGIWGFELGQCMCGSAAYVTSLAVPMEVDVGHHSAHEHQLRSTALLVASRLPLLSAT